MDSDLAKRYAEYRRLREKGKESLQQNAHGKAMEYYSRAINEALRIGKMLPPGEESFLGLVPAEQRVRCFSSAAEHNASTCLGCCRYLEIPACYANRAHAFTHLKKFREALADAERAIALAPTWPKGYYRKAEALLGAEQYQEARLFYLQVLEMEPQGSSSAELLQLKLLNVDLLVEARETRLYFRPLIPGVHICKGTWNPLTRMVYEFAKRMQNVVYVIGDLETRECAVVDPCWDVDGIWREVCEVDGMKISAVLATHNHFDHVGGKPPSPFDSYGITVGGVAKLLERLPERAKVFVHEDDAELLLSEALVPAERIRTTRDGDFLEMGRHRIEFVHTPGHTPGSQCIRFGPNLCRTLTGDTLFCGACGRVDFPGGNASVLYASLFERLANWPDNTAIFPAHSYGGKLMTTIGFEKRHGVLKIGSRDEFFAKMGVHLG